MEWQADDFIDVAIYPTDTGTIDMDRKVVISKRGVTSLQK